jgi:hypothetical protein
MNLSDLSNELSPKPIHKFFRSSKGNEQATPQLHIDESSSTHNDDTKSEPRKSLLDCSQHDSLAFQLDCVAGTDSDATSTDSAPVIAFPNLPATVSDSSCTAGLTRSNLIRQASSPEKQTKESFGWFVDLDDHETVETRLELLGSVSCEDLGFQASTAPKRDSNEAEVQWAKAADTVDDVLGDFF